MTTSLARAKELVAMLEAVDVRAYADVSVATPPCVLLVPPDYVFDGYCSATLTWSMVAIAPAPAAVGAGSNSWALLDDMLTKVMSTDMGVRDVTLTSYVLNGKTYPAYVLNFEEAMPWP